MPVLEPLFFPTNALPPRSKDDVEARKGKFCWEIQSAVIIVSAFIILLQRLSFAGAAQSERNTKREPFFMTNVPVVNSKMKENEQCFHLSLLTLHVPIIAILDIWKTTRVYEGESVVYDGFKYVWPVKG